MVGNNNSFILYIIQESIYWVPITASVLNWIVEI